MVREPPASESPAHPTAAPDARPAGDGVLLQTKLHIPGTTAPLLARPRLTRLLNDQPDGCLALISAPAGYGKTTLVAGYVRQLGRPVGWLTLDPQENDPVLFWQYVIAALQRANPHLGRQALATLSVMGKESPETAVALLINDLAGSIAPDAPLTLVLDDFHWIQTAAVFQSLNFLLQRQPPQLRLLLLTRSDPSLSLVRLRVAGRLLELRAGDLRLTPVEMEAFLNEVMTLGLPEEAVALLGARTEGWAAGLQLAALSLRQARTAGPASPAHSLTGATRHVFAFLVEEVLRYQPPEIRAFLQQTAVLNKFSPALCAAVTGQADAGQILHRLAAENLFISSLDDQGEWYRYHPLFAEALQVQLDAETRSACHRRAARWYAGQQLLLDAIQNALAAEDYRFMAELLARSYKEFLARGLLVSLQHWLSLLPGEYVSPRLRLVGAWCRVYESSEQELRELVAQIEPFLTDDDPLRGEMNAVQAVYASLYGDPEQGIGWATEALALAAPDDFLSRAAAYHGLGNAYRAQGKLDAALAAYGQARQQFAAMGHVFMSQLPLYRSAHVLIMQGRLRQALQTYESVRKIAQEAGHEPIILSGEIFGHLSELYCEWNELDQALVYARREIELARSGKVRLALVDGYLNLARVTAAQGEPIAAREALVEAVEVARQLHSAPVAAQVAMSQARLELDCGALPAAVAWADDYAVRRGAGACLLTPVVMQASDLMLARVRLAQGQTAPALAILEEVLERAEAAGQMRLVVEASVLQALAWGAQKQAASRKALVRALTLGKGEGYVRVFIENGPSLAPMLQQLRHLFPVYVPKLLAALQAGEAIGGSEATLPLPEPLTARELEVVALIAQGCSNREIAETLVLSVGTVKGHLNHIFGKLGVRNRTQALLRVRELNLLDT